MQRTYDQIGKDAALDEGQQSHKCSKGSKSCSDATSGVALNHLAGEPDLKHYGKVWFEPYA
eukprot:3947566-Amphidinium_carterae.2